MIRVLEILLTGIVILLFILLVVFWYEADKEVQILWGMISSAVSIEKAEEILETGEFLNYK